MWLALNKNEWQSVYKISLCAWWWVELHEVYNREKDPSTAAEIRNSDCNTAKEQQRQKKQVKVA